jgi:hypothetical protein
MVMWWHEMEIVNVLICYYAKVSYTIKQSLCLSLCRHRLKWRYSTVLYNNGMGQNLLSHFRVCRPFMPNKLIVGPFEKKWILLPKALIICKGSGGKAKQVLQGRRREVLSVRQNWKRRRSFLEVSFAIQ